MRKKITILPGDGIGKEVTAEGKRVLEKIADVYGHDFQFDEALIGHAAIEVSISEKTRLAGSPVGVSRRLPTNPGIDKWGT